MSDPNQDWTVFREAMGIGRKALSMAAETGNKEQREFYCRLVEAAARLAQAAK